MLLEFWIGVGKDWQELPNNAVMILIGFSTTNLCEREVSSFIYVKRKNRSKLNVEDDI